MEKTTEPMMVFICFKHRPGSTEFAEQTVVVANNERSRSLVRMLVLWYHLFFDGKIVFLLVGHVNFRVEFTGARTILFRNSSARMRSFANVSGTTRPERA